MRTILALCGILAAFEFGAYGAKAAPGGGERFRAEARGFGSVEVALRTYGEGAERSSWTTFQAEDEEHATVLGSKRLADLLGFGDIEPVTDADLPGTVLALDGWSAAADLEVLTPAESGTPRSKPLYYETRFTLPAARPAKRLWLASSSMKMRRFFINNYEVAEFSAWGSLPEIYLAEIDISGLVRRDGENVQRWAPDPQAPAIPDLKLLWTE